MTLRSSALLLVCCFAVAARGEPGYDVPASLQKDLPQVTAIVICASDTYDGSSMSLKRILSIEQAADVRMVTEPLSRAAFEPIPNSGTWPKGWRSIGAPLYAAFLGPRGKPLFVAYISPLGDGVSKIKDLIRDGSGRLRAVSHDMQSDSPSYMTRDEGFRRAIYDVFKSRAPARSKEYWSAPF